MKTFFWLTTALLLLSLQACDPRSKSAESAPKAAGSNETAEPVTEVQFESTSHDFGTIRGDQKVAHTYKFKNVGKYPLKIKNIKTSCGCTSKNYSKDPVPAGQQGFVTLEFDPTGKKGEVQKSATVLANTADKPVLRFKAVIDEATAKPEAAKK